MSNKKSITVHYRRMENNVNMVNGPSLEKAIRSAMATSKGGIRISDNWIMRAYPVPADNESTYLMNIFHDEGVGFFGDLTLYSKGFMQALLENDPNASMLNVKQQLPPKNYEYIHSMMYWLAIGDHVLMVQSRSLGSKHLEQYLTWLLREKTNHMNSDSEVILNAKFDNAQVGGDLDDIREIVVGGAADVVQPMAVESLPDPNSIDREVRKQVDV